MYLRIGQAAKIMGVSPSTLRRWEQEQKLLPEKRTQGNHRRYDYNKLEQVGEKTRSPSSQPSSHNKPKKSVVIYARVSAPKQKEDLQRQIETLREYATHQGWNILKIYTDIGSGINDTRKQLLRLLTDLPLLRPAHILCTYKDRIARFGTTMLEHTAKIYGTTLLPIGMQQSDNCEQEEMVQTIMDGDTLLVFRQTLPATKEEEKKGGTPRYAYNSCIKGVSFLRAGGLYTLFFKRI